MNDPARGESSPDGGFRRGGGNATRAASIGHVHLKVAALDRALAFDHGVLGFEITQRSGPDAAFLSAGGHHHHIGLNTWESKGTSPPPRGSTGLSTSRFSTQRARSSPTRCGGFSPRPSPSTAPRTTA